MTPDESSKLNYIYNALAKSYGDQLTAIINVMRSELSPQIAQAVLFPGQPYNGFLALANNQAAIMKMIQTLDPDDETDFTAFKKELEASEKRTAESVKASVEGLAATLRAQISTSISEGLDEGVTIPPEAIENAVDEAFGKIFTNYTP